MRRPTFGFAAENANQPYLFPRRGRRDRSAERMLRLIDDLESLLKEQERRPAL